MQKLTEITRSEERATPEQRVELEQCIANSELTADEFAQLLAALLVEQSEIPAQCEKKTSRKNASRMNKSKSIIEINSSEIGKINFSNINLSEIKLIEIILSAEREKK